MIGSSEDFESDFDFFVKEHGFKVQVLKFIYSEEATKFCDTSTVDLSYVVPNLQWRFSKILWPSQNI